MEGSISETPIIKSVDKIPDVIPILPLRDTVVFPETVTPLADVYYVKESHSVIVKLEIPGIAPNGVHLTLQDKTLIVEGSRFDPHSEGEKVYQQMEIDYGPFKRKIMLPVAVDVDASKASYVDGFLTIELPVAEQKTSAIKVPISVKDKK